jgi:hypothetical protein
MPASRTKITTRLLTRAALVILGICLALATVAFAAGSAKPPAAHFWIHVTPRTQHTTLGHAARFRVVAYHRDHRFVRLSVGRLPRGVTGTFIRDRRRVAVSTLVLTVARTARPGRDGVMLRGLSAGRRVAVGLRLVVSRPARFPFVVAHAAVQGKLAPGRSLPINLGLSNPYSFAIAHVRLTVRVLSVKAPDATHALPCTSRDFSTSAFSGRRVFRLRQRSRISLRGLGFPSNRWPHITMIDRPVNQDGCKHATVIFRSTGTATRALS